MVGGGDRVDLGQCSSWLKFCEIHHDDRTTVVFLCGGGVRAVAEVRVVLEGRGGDFGSGGGG